MGKAAGKGKAKGEASGRPEPSGAFRRAFSKLAVRLLEMDASGDLARAAPFYMHSNWGAGKPHMLVVVAHNGPELDAFLAWYVQALKEAELDGG